MQYLVTGTAGMIGSRVAAMLLDLQHSVVGVDSINDAYDQRLKQWRLAQLTTRDGFVFGQVDISDRDSLSDFWLKHGPFDAVINLAARAGVRPSVANPWVYFDANVTGTLNLLELCRHHGIAKFVLASSSSLYGLGTEMPYQETMDTDHPVSPYAASKKAAETLCYTYHHLHGIDVTVFRYFTVYGPAGRPDMSVFRFVQWIAEGRDVIVYGQGDQSRDFTYVDDIARGTIAGLRPVGYEVINLGSDHPITVSALIETVERKLNKPARIEHQPAHAADVLATWADISKARRLLDWQPRVPFDEGIQHAVDWYLRERHWARDIRT